MNSVELLGRSISRLGLDGAITTCVERIDTRRGGYVCFVNVHTLTESAEDPVIASALDGAALRVADGVPLLWLARAKGRAIEGRVCGPDFFARVLETERDRVHGFIGGAQGQAQDLAKRYGVDAIAYSPPMRPFSVENATADWVRFCELSPSGEPPALVWVGLGAPKQEQWMQVVSTLAPNVVFFGVGAAFDFLAGTKARAPRWMQRAGLEWAHRLASEPSRLWRRYLMSNTRFALLAAKDMVGF